MKRNLPPNEGYYLFGTLQRKRVRWNYYLQSGDPRKWCVWGKNLADAKRRANSYWGAAFTAHYGIRVKRKDSSNA